MAGGPHACSAFSPGGGSRLRARAPSFGCLSGRALWRGPPRSASRHAPRALARAPCARSCQPPAIRPARPLRCGERRVRGGGPWLASRPSKPISVGFSQVPDLSVFFHRKVEPVRQGHVQCPSSVGAAVTVMQTKTQSFRRKAVLMVHPPAGLCPAAGGCSEAETCIPRPPRPEPWRTWGGALGVAGSRDRRFASLSRKLCRQDHGSNRFLVAREQVKSLDPSPGDEEPERGAREWPRGRGSEADGDGSALPEAPSPP